MKGFSNMRRLLILTTFLAFCLLPAFGQQPACAEFQRDVKAIYNFKPALLKTEEESTAKSAAMDRFWNAVKAKPNELLPCLRAAVADPQSDPWFRFDGSNLLVSVDPSPASKAEQVRQYTSVDLGDLSLEVWVSTLARRGAEGFDVSEAGARWLAYPDAKYYLPQHGAQEVDRLLGAIFIFGSMDETQATPALLKIAASTDHPGRSNAISLLLMQATPEALRGLKAVNLAGLPEGRQAVVRRHLEQPITITPSEKPNTSRAQFLKAFEGAVKGDWKNLSELERDSTKDAVVVLKPEDVPLVRRVRRARIAHANPHAADDYVSFTQILMTMIWKPEMTK